MILCNFAIMGHLLMVMLNHTAFVCHTETQVYLFAFQSFFSPDVHQASHDYSGWLIIKHCDDVTDFICVGIQSVSGIPLPPTGICSSTSEPSVGELILQPVEMIDLVEISHPLIPKDYFIDYELQTYALWNDTFSYRKLICIRMPSQIWMVCKNILYKMYSPIIKTPKTNGALYELKNIRILHPKDEGKLEGWETTRWWEGKSEVSTP